MVGPVHFLTTAISFWGKMSETLARHAASSVEGYSWLPAKANQQASSSGPNDRHLPPLKKNSPLKSGLRPKQTNIENSVQCKKSLICVMGRNCLKFTDQQMSAWALLLYSDKQLTKAPQSRSRRSTPAAFCKLPSPAGGFLTPFTLHELKVGTKPASV